MPENLSWWRPAAALAGFAFLLHFAWEMLQFPLYAGMSEARHDAATWTCAMATVGDVAIALVAYGAASAAARSAQWVLRPRSMPLAVYLGAGLGVTVAVEWVSVHRWERWRYAGAMPLVLGVGLAPLVQWVAVPLLTRDCVKTDRAAISLRRARPVTGRAHMGYKSGVDREQQVLFPETVDEYVAADNPVRVIDAFVDGLDMVNLGFERAVPADEGRPGYDPRDLLKLFIYGYLNRTRSSRQLERETHRNVEVIWLMRTLRPDHKTIAEFRRRHAKELRGVAREFRLVCVRLDLLGGETVFIDGSKIRAVNSKDRSFTKKKLEWLLARIDGDIQAYLSEAEAQDAAEAGQPGATDPRLEEKLKALRERRALYEGLRKQLEETGESQVSLTDPDSRLMKLHGDLKVCYNVQIAVDAKHHLIVEHDVTNQENDEHQLAPMAVAAKEALGVETLEVAADAGYHVGAQVVECEANGITPYAPKPRTSSKNEAQGLYTKEAFTYSGERDAYRCPAGQWLDLRTQTAVKGRTLSYYANWQACAGCPLRAQCTKSNKGRRIMRTPEEERLEAMAIRLRERPELMLQRKSAVEHPYGTMKWTGDGYYFLVKGLKKVRGEFSLMTLAYNLKRVLNLLGVECLLEALRGRRMPLPRPV